MGADKAVHCPHLVRDRTGRLLRCGVVQRFRSARHLFVTAFEDEKLYTQCFDRQTGELPWEESIARERKELTNKLNDPASSQH